MELEEYKLMFELEGSHWWYKGLHNLIFSTVNRIFAKRRGLSILDAGCGTGLTLKFLNEYGNAFGIDISTGALKYCRIRGLNKILKASIMQIPFRNETFDLVMSLDVLYHRLVMDDISAIREIHRVLKKNGILIINLAAYSFLERPHDRKVHTRHRYTKNELYLKLQNSNFKVMKICYRNTFLLFILLFHKLLGDGKINKNLNSDLRPMNSIINSILYNILKIENLLLKTIDIPFGTSIFCISKKI